MMDLGLKSLKDMNFFSKKEKKQDKTKILLQIIDRIEKENPEKKDQLQDLRIDIEENIPLTSEKKIYLKNEIDCFKNSKKNLNQEIKKQDLKIDCEIPEFENVATTCTASLSTLEQMIKKIEVNSDLLYQETNVTHEEEKLEQIQEKNNLLQDNLRTIISNLNITYSEILNQLSKAKSVQTKMAILNNELDLKRDSLK